MNRKTQHPGAGNWLWLGLLGAAMGYVLSTGPVVRLYLQTQDPTLRRTSAALYAPLRLLDDTRAGTALGNWIRWCCQSPPAAPASPAPSDLRTHG